MIRRALALGLLAAVGSTAPAAAAARFRSCPEEGRGATCADVVVPLDRSGAIGGTVGLRTMRLDARKRGAGPRRAAVYLSGGPGGAGLEEARFGLADLRSVRADHDLVAFDQRGTGDSGLLRCPALERDPRLRSVRAGEACAARIGPRRALYTTRTSVEDLEAIREAVQADQLLLYGVSYGTKVALAYARAHPDRVERLILDSIVDPDDADPFSMDSYRAIAPSLRALCPDACAGISADPASDLAGLVPALHAKPLRGDVWRADGTRRRRSVSALDVSDLLFDADYAPALRAAVPAAVRAAATGDATPLLRLQELARPLAELPEPHSFAAGRYATLCEEAALPWARGTPFEQRAAEAQRRADAVGAAAFFPLDYATARADEIDLCLHWPEAAEAPVLAPATYPDVPALLLQGEEDLRTPPETSLRVASTLSRPTRVSVGGVGHAVLASDTSRCAARALRAWLRDAAVAPTCPRVETGAPASGVPPRSLSQLEPAAGIGRSRKVSRTVTAIDRTLDDVIFVLGATFESEGAGLRGGTFRFSARSGLHMRGVSWVPGVRISGARTRGGALRLRVSGRAAAHGQVTLSRGGVLRGRLGGRRVVVALGGGPPEASAARAHASVVTLPRVFRHRRALPVRRLP